ncbi:MAG: PAS domain S-box protein [Gammaproteobacteria bacterium]|nr:PAS domain S-box protein [Gammaproteobacteria bacterium]
MSDPTDIETLADIVRRWAAALDKARSPTQRESALYAMRAALESLQGHGSSERKDHGAGCECPEPRVHDRIAELAHANRTLRASMAGHARTEQELRLLKQLVVAIAGAGDSRSAMATALRRICEVTDWDCAEAWLVDPANQVLTDGPWYSRDFSLTPFHRATSRFAQGQGLPGRVWATQRAQWLEDLSDPNGFVRAEAARRVGLRTGVAIPVLEGGELLGVLAFFMRRRRRKDARLLELVTAALAPLAPMIHRRRVEDQMERLNEELERRVAERTAALTQANQTLQEEILERRRIEEVLREREARVRAILDTALEAIITTDERGVIDTFNPAAERMFGYSAAQVIGRNVSMLMPSPHQKWHEKYIQSYTATGVKRIIGVPGREVEGLRRDGTVFPMELAVGEYHDGRMHRFTGLAHDITERKKMEEDARKRQAELAHVMRLTAMGEMASMLAHEINQPLHAISAYCRASQRLMRSDRLDMPKLTDALERTAQQAQRAGEIVRRIRSFVRKADIQPISVALNDLVRDVVSFNEPLIRAQRIELALDLDHTLRPVSGDPIQLEQVLFNLVRNAMDALSGHAIRRLVIRTRCSGSSGIRLTVSDSGPGLDEEAHVLVFEPFYTTKEDGIGIGLPISRSIVEAHGGRLWLESAPGEGADFHLDLPIDNNMSQAPVR